MTRIIHFPALPLALLALLAFANTGCKQTGCTDPTAITFDPEAVESDPQACEYPILSLDVNLNVGNQPLQYDQVYQINGVATRFSTVQLYLDEFRVGMNNEMDMLDANLLIKPSQTTYELGQITAGHKHMLMFALGVDSSQNFLDPATYDASHPLAPKAPSMHWSWNSGYIFLRIDGEVDTNGDGTPDEILELHLGTMNMYTPVMLEAHADADMVDTRINLDIDIAQLFDGIDHQNERVTHTMDNMPLAMSLRNNFMKLFSVQ